MVGHPGAAPSVSCSRNRRIAVFLVSDEIGGHDGTRFRFLLRDRQASRLLRPHGQKLVGSGSNALLVVFPDLFCDGPVMLRASCAYDALLSAGSTALVRYPGNAPRNPIWKTGVYLSTPIPRGNWLQREVLPLQPSG
jgi:hypothetical protein